MGFINSRLPQEIEIGAVARDDEDIEIVETDGNYEQRNAHTSEGLLEYEVAMPSSTRDAANYNAVINLYKAARKSLHYWLFRDWRPQYSELDDELIGTGDGATTTFQLTKKHTVDGYTYTRTVTRPVSPVSVKKNGVVLVSGYSVNYSTGVVTFTAAPTAGHAIRVTGNYDIPVRFDSPLEMVGQAIHLDHIETFQLKEVRE